MNKRLINIRPLFVALIGIITGIYFSQLIFLTDENINKTLWITVLCIVVVLLLLCVVFSYFKFSGLKLSSFFKRHKINFTFLLIFLLIGLSVMSINIAVYKNKPEFSGEFVVVGEIEDSFYGTSQYTKITLNNVVISNDEITVKLPSKLNVFIFQSGIISEDMVSGKNCITFTANITKTPLNNRGYNFTYYINNAIYSAENIENINFLPSRYDADEFVRNEFKQTLHSNLSYENANIAYSLLFGNDEVLSSEIMDLFTDTGIVHIISVSGLHIAVLVAVITIILNKLKVKNNIQLIIIFIILAFYSYLCGFVPTVLRSAIMSLVFLLSYKVGRQYDALSSLSLSAVVLLIIRPIDLFSVGFHLSFISMFGLLTLAPVLNKVFSKTKLPKAVYYSLSASIAATLLTFPVVVYYFGQFATYGILSNLIVVPLLSFAYVVIFGLSIIVIPLKFLGFLFIVPEVIIHFSKICLQLINNLPFNVINMFSDGYLSLFILILMAFIVRFLMVSKKVKTVIVLLLLSIFTVNLVVTNLPAFFNENALHINYQNNSNYSIITTQENEKILVGANIDNLAKFTKYVNSLKINHINSVIAYDFSHLYLNDLSEICDKYKVENLYLFSPNDNCLNLDNQFTGVKNVYLISDDENYSVNNINFNVLIDLDTILGVKVEFNDSNMLFVTNSLPTQYLLTLRFFDEITYDYVIINNVRSDLNYLNINTQNLITHKINNSQYESIYNVRELEKLVLKI